MFLKTLPGTVAAACSLYLWPKERVREGGCLYERGEERERERERQGTIKKRGRRQEQCNESRQMWRERERERIKRVKREKKRVCPIKHALYSYSVQKSAFW